MNNATKPCFFLLAACSCAWAIASDSKIGVTADTPTVSPATNEIAFSSDLDGPTRVWAVGADGKGLRKISRTSPAQSNIFEVEPTWSPDGRHIAYVSIVDGAADIWVMNSDGSYAIQLTHNGANNTRPAWSPDGSKMAFVSDKDGTKDIWLMNAEGAGQTKIVNLPGEENRPSFSPKGDQIVFSESDNGAARLMVASVSGGPPKALTNGNFRDWDPNWGVDGIVFSSNRDQSGHWKLYTVQPDGSGLRAVGNVRGLAPVWMNDGRVAFSDEIPTSRALVSISLLDTKNNVKQAVVDIQGYPVGIDIRPGSSQNNVNPKSRGKIEVAILSTKEFDAVKDVITTSLTFGQTGNEASLDSCSKTGKDVNSDGLPDLLCHFALGRTSFADGDSIGNLRFYSTDGRPFAGNDPVRIVPTDDSADFSNDSGNH